MEENETVETVESVEIPEVAEPVEQTEPQAEPQPQDSKTNAAFAEMRRQTENYQKELNSRDEWVSKTFGQYGVKTWSDYQAKMEEQINEQKEQEYKEQGIDPNLIDEIVKNHPAIKKAEEFAKSQEESNKFNNEANELFKAFPNLDLKTVPKEVFELNQKGVPLLVAYKATQFDSVKKSTEQEVLNKIKNNGATSPGPLSSGVVPSNTGIKTMTNDDFKKLQERVLREGNVQI